MSMPVSRATVALLGFLVIAGFFLTTEHRAHVFGILPFLLLLACPLLHFFMHGSHGSHTDQPAEGGEPDPHASHRATGEDVR